MNYFDTAERNQISAAFMAQQYKQQQDKNSVQGITGQMQNMTIQPRLKDITNENQQSDSSEFKFVYTVPSMIDPEPITCIIEPTDELGGLYLGGYEAASNLDILRKYKIRAVLTASIETALQYSEEVVHFHEVIQAHDRENYDIIQHFEKAYEFIDRNRKYTNVFVHCFLGISRSVSLVVAFLMKKYNLNFEKALWKIKSKRRQVNPNVGFVKQLQQYEKYLQQAQVQAIAPAPMIPKQLVSTYPQMQGQPGYISRKSETLDPYKGYKGSFFSQEQQYSIPQQTMNFQQPMFNYGETNQYAPVPYPPYQI